MGEFNSASLWIKVAFLVMAGAFLLDLTAFATPGWSSSNYGCTNGRYCGSSGAVEFTLVVGFLCILTGTALIVCLIFLDELKDNKAALIAFVVFALLGGLLVIIGVAVYNSEYSTAATFSTLLTVMCGLLCILAGIFGILELVGVKA